MKRLLIILLSLGWASAQTTNYARMLNGVNYQTGTTYTFVAADALRVTSFNNPSSISATLPPGSTTGFQAGTVFSVQNTNVGGLTITCSGCTINGSSTLTLSSGQSADVYSDGTNYVANKGGGGGGGGTPGGLNTNIQFNNSGAFGGIASPATTGILFNSVAGSPPTFTNEISVTNPQSGSDPNDRRWGRFTFTTDSTTSNPGAFNDENGLEIVQNVQNGYALYSNAGGATRAKKTFLPLAITGNMQGAGQRFLRQEIQNCYPSESDCFLETQFVTYQNTPITGDEGSGFRAVSALDQPSQLNLNTINSSARTSCNTTTTQSLTPSITAQAFTVASTVGCNVNDWVVLGREVATGSPQEEAMQITAVGGGTITGVVVGNHANGAGVTPATVLFTPSASTPWGQGGVVIDETRPSYTTGTISTISGAGVTGSSTVWTNAMVGGDATLPGCIAFTADTFTGGTFSGVGANGPLQSWYRITGVASNTSLSILSWSTAQDAAYHGYAPGAGGYTISPCAKVLRVLGGLVSNQLILETNTFTWTNGDQIEEAIGAYPDISAYQINVGESTAGGVRRTIFSLGNNGARTISNAIQIGGIMAAGGNADTTPFDTAINLAGVMNIGIKLAAENVAAINMLPSSSSPDAIVWGSSTQGPRLQSNWVAGTPHLAIQTVNGQANPLTQGTTSGSMVFTPTDPVDSSSMPTGQYVGRFDVVNFNNATNPRLGLFGTGGNTWYIRPAIFSSGPYSGNATLDIASIGANQMLQLDTNNQEAMLPYGKINLTESTAPAGTAGFDMLWSDSTAHRLKMNNNNAGADAVGDDLQQFCGSTSACSHTNILNPQIVSGSAPLVSGTPSTVTITGFSPAFTSTSTFVCTVSNATTAADTLKVVNASASSITITGPNTVTDTVNYICVGN